MDTVGAGDSFMSALLSAMGRDGALGADSAAPTRAKLESWLQFSACASAITCTRRGSDPPTLVEVESALKGVSAVARPLDYLRTFAALRPL